uniref:Cytochrome P450, family 7, subfamily B, polypeptide 1 n=1 Tax=Electrophorus electricus TaxID=8005 RepID=A0A4W4FPL2_ELEEL
MVRVGVRVNTYITSITLVTVVVLTSMAKKGEPPLIKGWIPFLGKALEFRKDSYQFLQWLQQKHGDIFTVLIAGKYMTFVMNPLLYPAVIKQGKQLNFHKFADVAASTVFSYPLMCTERFPGMSDQVQKCFLLLQGSALDLLTFRMMGNLQLILRRYFLSKQGEELEYDWHKVGLYEFCDCVMFEATFLTLYGQPPDTNTDEHTHSGKESWTDGLRDNFKKFDRMFPLLLARVPISLLGKTKCTREKLIRFFHPCRMADWTTHHFATLWASVGNTIPASFWCLYHLLSNPQALASVREEIIGVIGEEEAEAICRHDMLLTREQLDRMIYLESAVKESLRLSSASMNIRVVQEDFSLHLNPHFSVCVRKGDIVALYPPSTHQDPNIYLHPQKYMFDRFVEDQKEKTEFYKGDQKVRYYHMPFGSGVSMCPGRFFAINGLKQFVCITLLMCDMQLAAGQKEAVLDTCRAGLGILPPANYISFNYRLKGHFRDERTSITTQQRW